MINKEIMQALDYQIFQLINQFAGKWHFLDTLMIALAKYGPLLFAIPLLYLWFKKGEDGKQVAILAIISLAVALLINQIIGHIYFRPRPFAFHQVNTLLPKSPDPSFPSDHVTFSFAIASIVYLFNKRIGTYAVLLGFLVALARVFVGMHYPFDVLGGAFIGLITGYIVWKLRPRLEVITSFVIGVAKKIKLA